LRRGSRGNYEHGVVITLISVFMLFVVGAMAALSIDVVTIYTARSEAQLAADGAALAAARVLANSGATSETTSAVLTSVEAAAGPAQTVAVQVAEQNQVGGASLTPGEITVTFGGTTLPANPTVTVSVQVTSLPTFFARIWGTKFITVGASATAEAYNPSPTGASTATPVAPACVKPWLLPNIDPSPAGTTIFSAATGAITNPALLGWTSGTPLQTACSNNCSPPPLPAPTAWNFYPGDPATTFLPPTQALPTCAPALTTPYEESIAGCIQTNAIACNSTANIDTNNYFTRKTETARAVNCLTHTNANQGDQVDPAYTSPPFEFLAGNDNPITGLAGNDVMVSDSLVTVPVFNSTTGVAPTNPVQIIGFVQLFLNPNGMAAPTFGMNRGKVNTTIINMAGCGTSASGTPILGNGASPVAVRLISP
jgi:Flp pilus assembly protein TadG